MKAASKFTVLRATAVKALIQECGKAPTDRYLMALQRRVVEMIKEHCRVARRHKRLTEVEAHWRGIPPTD